MNVDQDRTYPSRLAVVLREQHPETTFELLNFGVLGYSSFQGRQLFKTRVMDLHPDIVAIGFGNERLGSGRLSGQGHDRRRAVAAAACGARQGGR